MLLTSEQIYNNLAEYYKTVCGEQDTDQWIEHPATNVWKFVRDGKTIVLMCNIITGKVTERVHD